MKDYVYSGERHHTIDAMVYTCGYEECAPGHSYGPAVRSGFLVHHVLYGHGVYRVSNGKTEGKVVQKTSWTTYELGPGDSFLIKPDELIYYEALRNDPWAYTWIGFKGHMAADYLRRSSVWETPVFSYRIDDEVGTCHQKMYDASQLPRNRDIAMTSVLYEFLYALCERFPAERKGHEDREARYIDTVLGIIDNNYASPLTVEELADAAGIDRSHLYRLFKQRTGLSIKDYLIQLRMDRARELLRQTDLTMGAVARSVGYNDALYFSRLFKKRIGVAPTAYRRQH